MGNLGSPSIGGDPREAQVPSRSPDPTVPPSNLRPIGLLRKGAEDIGDLPDSNLRTKARAVRVLRRIRNASHDYTKCVLDDLLSAIASVLVRLGLPLVFHFAISPSTCCATTSKNAPL